MYASKDIIEDMGANLVKPGLPLLAKRSVNVYSDMGNVVREGDIITLTGELVGFENADVQNLQWQFDDGMFWVDVPGANDLTHAFVATPETINYSWRLSVTTA